jgi:hypothetical protein
MEAEARREHERLTVARRLMPNRGATIELVQELDHHALVTFAKRRWIRRRLRARPLVVVRYAVVDSSGQLIAYHLLPIQLLLDDQRSCSFQELEQLREQLPRTGEYDVWLTSSVSTHSAFWSTRLTRERHIANLERPLASGGFQPGLFDLRADRAWADEQDQQRDCMRERHWFANLTTRQAALEIERPQIALVLFTQ